MANSSENPNVVHCSTWREMPGLIVMGDAVTEPDEYCRAPAVSLVASDAVNTKATDRNSTPPGAAHDDGRRRRGLSGWGS